MKFRRKLILVLLSLLLLYLYYVTRSAVLTIGLTCIWDQNHLRETIGQDLTLNCKKCNEFKFRDLSYLDNIVNRLNAVGDRHKNIQFLRLDGQEDRLVLKYRKDFEIIKALKRSVKNNENGQDLKTIFKRHLSSRQYIGQPHFCTWKLSSALDVFLDKLEKTTALTEDFTDILLMANFNLEIYLLKFLNDTTIPVPRYLSNCGLCLIETYEGLTLDQFYQANILQRLEIAKNLIRGALQLTSGYEGFRIYLTDATKDNIAVNKKTLAISFIDLDDVILNHESLFKMQSFVKTKDHRHELISCSNCFAYSTHDICSAPRSDINIFSICQLLLEDLNGNRRNGFLYLRSVDQSHQSSSFQSSYNQLIDLLSVCVYCDKGRCPNRYILSDKLIGLIRNMLKQ